MNIKFTVEDYFKELQLMESQYGQEEELAFAEFLVAD